MPKFQLSYGFQSQVLINSTHNPSDIANKSADLWLTERNNNRIKSRNKQLQQLLVEKVYRAFCRLPNECHGLVLPNESQQKEYPGCGIEFRIGAPFTWCSKISPNGNYIYSYSYLSDKWRDAIPNTKQLDTVRNLYLQGNATKYRHVVLDKTYSDYILFCHQGFGPVHYYKIKDGLSLAKEISQWAKDNRKLVIFRIHPTSEDKNISELKELLEHKYLILDRTSYIVDLVNNSKQVWTISSACGMEAVLMNKPVSIFGLTDYQQVVNNCKGVDEAYKEDFNQQNYEKFLTWYMNDLCINILSDEAEQKIFKRMKGFLHEGFQLSDLY